MATFRQGRTWRRARRLGLCQLAALARRTITGLICVGGRQFQDWSADYRVFSRGRWGVADLFAPVVRGILELLAPEKPLVVALDDTRLPKTGRKIPGAAYARDPRSPPFHVNLTRGQRFVQLAALVPAGDGPCAGRGVPVRFHHQPPVAKVKPSATAQEKQAYARQRRENNLSTGGRDLIRQLREELDGPQGAGARKLVIAADGSYTNRTVLRALPERTTFIGRIRKDAKLYHVPRADQQPAVGNKRRYGDRAPTPEQLRQEETLAWRAVPAWASGKTHNFRVKELAPVLWRTAGPSQPVRIIVIAPLGYRLRKAGPTLYHQPAYLLSTDLEAPLEELLQQYLWRWQIEVNHRDEKQLIGVGQAQVRSASSVERHPALAVASYAYLLLASIRLYGINEGGPAIPRPKWQNATQHPASTQSLLQQLRSEVWAEALERLEVNCGDFEAAEPGPTKSEKLQLPLESAVLYARTG